MRGTECPRHYAALLFSCQKDLRGTECPRHYARTIIFVFFCNKKRGCESYNKTTVKTET